MIDVAGFIAVAEIQYGSNGAQSANPEVHLGSATDANSLLQVWDDGDSDGFDSGWVQVSLHLKAGGGTNGVTLSIGNSSPTQLVFSGASYTGLNDIVFRAEVDGIGMFAAWSNLNVHYFYESECVEELVLGSGNWPLVNTTTQTSGFGTYSEILIGASGTPNDEVIVTGSFRLAANYGVYPSADSLKAQIFVMPD